MQAEDLGAQLTASVSMISSGDGFASEDVLSLTE